MKKIVIFGTGSHYKNHKDLLDDSWEIIAFADNDLSKVNTFFEGKPIISPERLVNDIIFDQIVIATMVKDQVIKQLIQMKIPVDKITIINCYGLVNPKDYTIVIDEKGYTKFHIENINFICRTRSDYNVVQELYDEGTYNYVNKEHKSIVIDIGMNTAIAALYFAQNPNISKIYSFEPFEETYQQAIENIKMNIPMIQDKIVSYNYGLDNKNETKYFVYNKDFSGGMSTIGKGLEESDNTVSIEVQDAGINIRNIIQNHIKEKVILKMDCEGSEYDIFESIEREKLFRDIDVILLEWHIYEKNKKIEDILQNNNFQYILQLGNGGRGFIYAFKCS